MKISSILKSKHGLLARTVLMVILQCQLTPGVAQSPLHLIPPQLEKSYHFDFKKLFYKSDQIFEDSVRNFGAAIKQLDEVLKKPLTKDNLASTTNLFSSIEYRFRQLDLYLFLQFATDTKKVKSAKLEDSLHSEMVNRRVLFRERIRAVDAASFSTAIKDKALVLFRHFLESIRLQGNHELTNAQSAFIQPFNYLKDGQFYTEALNRAVFDPIILGSDTMYLFRDMGRWQNHPEASVRKEGKDKMDAGYRSAKQEIGYQYIEMVRGLDAFAKLKHFKGIIDENCQKLEIQQKVIEQILATVEAGAKKNASSPVDRIIDEHRFPIDSATRLMLAAFQPLGQVYVAEARDLLNPGNGRMDIVGSEDRLGMQGVASVYPIHTSVFFARNYEGFFIDLMVLSHEAGHAIQASMMARNKVSMLNGTGPGYFTESFGKFNELITCYFLVLQSPEGVEKKYYTEKYHERLKGLYGSASEADIEFRLIEGITSGKVKRPEDLDKITTQTLAIYENPEKGDSSGELWLQMETNYKAPLHNINDMLASILALQYFKQFLNDPDAFAKNYEKFLRNGYDDSPSHLLKKFLGIDMMDPSFTQSAIDLIQIELKKSY